MDTVSDSDSEDDDQSRSRRRYAWDEQTRSQVFTYLTQNMPVVEIRSRTGVSRRAIQTWKKQWSVDTDPFPSARGQGRSSANRQGRRAYDQQTRSRVFMYLAEGMPLQQISDRTGVSLPTIASWKKQESLLPTNPAKGMAWSQEVRSRVSRFLAEGMPVKEIEEKTGVPWATIYRWRRDDANAAAVPPQSVAEQSG